tara:strand:+ start:823 stop:1317 length:495 start_codon:yes stop_codon:yes gene_type:complete
MYLSKNEFASLVKVSPIVAIDLCIVGSKGILLGKRNNPPAKKYYFVPGGRVRKNEDLNTALERIFKDETGSDFKHFNFKKMFLGVYEHFYTDNFLDNHNFNTHYIVLSYLIEFPEEELENKLSINNQHSDLIWYKSFYDFNIKNIHENTIAYFSHEHLKTFLNK